MLSGCLSLILERDDGAHAQTLKAGQFAIVPKGVWHTADIVDPGQALFITLGDGTTHRDR